MRRVTALVWGLLAACGRIGFVPCIGCTASPDANGQIAVLGTGAGIDTGGVIAIPATRSGSRIVVGITSDTVDVMSVVDDGGNTYLSANITAQAFGGCARSAQVWYADNTHSATTITVTNIGTASLRGVWAVELVGTSGPPIAGMQATGLTSSDLVIAAPAVRAPADSIAFSVLTLCNGALLGVHFGSPFIGLPVSPSGALAYSIISTDSSYGAEWDLTGVSPTLNYGAGTVAFQ